MMKLQEMKNQLDPDIYALFKEKGVQELVKEMNAGIMLGISPLQAAQTFQAAAMLSSPYDYPMTDAIADYSSYVARLDICK